MAVLQTTFDFVYKLFHYCFTFLCLCLVISSLGNFQVFVSKQSLSFWDPELSVLRRFLWNLALIGLFIFQHSFMATEWFKSKLTSWLKISVSERLGYLISTSFCLLTLIFQWHSIPEAYLWYIDTHSGSRSLLWLFFLFCHVVAWFILGLELLLMDIEELLGISQVVAFHSGNRSPLLSKARKLREIFSRMRHPGVVMLTFILWFHPLMTLDRLLLASVFTTYMVGRHSLDDYHYSYAEKHMTCQWIERRSQKSVRYEYERED